MEGPNGKPFTTNQYALIAIGKSDKQWPFIACSNAKFTMVCKITEQLRPLLTLRRLSFNVTPRLWPTKTCRYLQNRS